MRQTNEEFRWQVLKALVWWMLGREECILSCVKGGKVRTSPKGHKPQHPASMVLKLATSFQSNKKQTPGNSQKEVGDEVGRELCITTVHVH